MAVLDLCILLLLVFNTGLTAGWSVILPAQVSALELDPVNITCSSDYDFDTNFTWTLPNKPSVRPTTPYLFLPMVMTEDAGNYVCTVTTVDSGERHSATVQLTVMFQPKWPARSVRKFGAAIGHGVILQCVVSAQPIPQFFWIGPSNANITSSSDYSIAASGNTSKLTVAAVRETNYGNYMCVAYNVAGLSRFPLSLLSPGIPDSPLACQLSSVAETTATILCDPGYDGGEDVTYIVYKAGPFVARQKASVTASVNGQQVQLDVADLTPGTNYTLLVYAQNSLGQSAEAFSISAITGGTAPPRGSGTKTAGNSILGPAVGGAVGGAVLVAIVLAIVIVACIKCRKRKSKSDGITRPVTNVYVSEDDIRSTVSQSSYSSRDVLSKNQNSSRKTKKPENAQHASAYYQKPTNTAGTSNCVLYLDHNPGESSVGFENAAYAGNHGPESVNSSVSSQNYGGQRDWNYQDRSDAVNVQPTMAGYGALQGIATIYGRSNNAIPNAYNLDRPVADVNKATGSTWAQPYSSPVQSTVPAYQPVQVRKPEQPTKFRPEDPWEFPREKLYIRQKIGEGSFGEVWRAKVDGIMGRSGQQVVAVKLLKDDYTRDEQKCLQKELDIMKRLQPHPNIVSLLGCCTRTKPLCIILELASNGCLQTLLRQQRSAFNLNNLDAPDSSHQRHVNLTSHDLVLFALQVASGMEYIASQQLLHRDLAARNVLLDEQMTCKISDFGFARDIIEMRQYESKTQRRLPIRWMAPESLMLSEYSVMTDVWSFGVLLWEIMTLGSTPYPGLSGPQVMDFVQKGRRMKKPKHCSDALYAMMLDCWNQFASKRPPFSVIHERLSTVFERQSEQNVYVDQMVENALEIVISQPGEKC